MCELGGQAVLTPPHILLRENSPGLVIGRLRKKKTFKNLEANNSGPPIADCEVRGGLSAICLVIGTAEFWTKLGGQTSSDDFQL